MMQITRKHIISSAHRLYDYDGRCERLHGHNYRIEATLSTPQLNRLGMIVDFAEIKKILFGALDAVWDHRTLLYTKDPLCAKLAGVLDDDSLCPVPFNPTAENMATYLGEEFFPSVIREAGMPEDLRIDKVVVHETDGSSACWSRD